MMVQASANDAPVRKRPEGNRQGELSWKDVGHDVETVRADTKLKPRLLADEHDGSPKLHISNNDCIASGNTVVASKAFAQEIRNALGPTVSAVEMEAKGLCEALAKIKNAPPALVVRGISDLADEEKAALEKNFKDSWRRWAAQNAARFVLLLIKWRTKIAEGYRPVARPAYNMKHHIDSGRICLQARIKAREVGERNIAFSPNGYPLH